MQKLKIFIIMSSVILLMFIIYFDIITSKKPYYWSLIRSLLGVLLTICALVYAYNKPRPN